jgi:hypothetical protein
VKEPNGGTLPPTEIFRLIRSSFKVPNNPLFFAGWRLRGLQQLYFTGQASKLDVIAEPLCLAPGSNFLYQPSAS